MSEADIRILEEFIKDYEAVTDPLEKSSYYEEVPIRSMKNLVNKYKEQEKIIELMVEKLSIYKFEEIICMEIECDHIILEQEGKCIGDKACILEYFRKKARGDK